VSATTWTWRYDDETGAALEQPRSEVFTSRGDAESWLGEHWSEVADAGGRRAQLLSGGTPVGRALPLQDALP
jgi:hypothetical protein